MATSVHLPEELLEKLDERARELGISRNQYIVRALRAAVHGETRWSPRFLEMLSRAAADAEGSQEVQEMMGAIAARRTRKTPPRL